MPIGNIAGVGGFTSFPWLVEELTTEELQTIERRSREDQAARAEFGAINRILNL
jgi:hypothetical protein